MFKTFNTPTKFAAILCVVLLSAFSTVSDGKKPPKDEPSDSSTTSTSVVVKRQKGFALFQILGWEVFGEVRRGALTAYMDEHGVNSVEITVTVTEELVQRDDGSSFYRLSFTFGPSGCYFDPPLELNIDGQYVAGDTEVWLYDENGDALQGEQSFQNDDQMTFYIPHFSSYSYDDYY